MISLFRLAIVLLCIVRVAPAWASSLAQSDFGKLARHCQPVDLAHWSHPTRRVLENADVHIVGVQICDNGRYPVFTVDFKYDPRGETTDYFAPLYAHMLAANGGWPFSFVDVDDRVIIDIGVGPARQVKVTYEDITP